MGNHIKVQEHFLCPIPAAEPGEKIERAGKHPPGALEARRGLVS